MRAYLFGLVVSVSVVAGCAVANDDTTSVEANLDTPPASQTKLAYAQTLRAIIDAIDAETAIAPSARVDRTALYARLEKELFAAPDTPAALVGALRKAELAYPSGHLGFTLDGDTCWSSPDVGFASSSRLGVCTQPFEDHAVVSAAAASALLRAGDEILAVNGKRGADMMRAALEQPMCTASSASASNRRFTAGTSLLALAKPGMTIEVRHVDGTLETKTVTPADMTAPRACRDPFGGDMSYLARSSRRGDVGIIRVPAFYGPQQEGETVEAWQERLRAELLAAFEEVKDAKAIVWDLRANGGGATPLGLEIVAGFAGVNVGASAGGYRFRATGTNTFYEPYIYRVPDESGFAFDGKVAMLIDGLTISAADYTARAAKHASNALIFGAPSAGAYGGGSQSKAVGEAPSVELRTDPYLGVDEDGETIIEGEGTEPTHPIELQPQDLARGVDTVLEAAISALTAP